jgi:hypothetical protein
MRSLEAREVMVARVQDAYAKWPRFEDMPVAAGNRAVPLNAAKYAETPGPAYVEALYKAAYQGDILGRAATSMDIAVNKEAPVRDPERRPAGYVLGTDEV